MKSLLKIFLFVVVVIMMICSFSVCSDNDDLILDIGMFEIDVKFKVIVK